MTTINYTNMLVRDILPPQKVARAEKVVREEILGLKPSASRKSNLFRLGWRAAFLAVLCLAVFSRDSGRALGYEDLLDTVRSGVAELGEGIVAGVGGILNPDQPEEVESFNSLKLETSESSDASAGTDDQPASGRMKFEQAATAGGRFKFKTRSLKGDDIEFAADELSGRPYLRSQRWGGEASLRINIPQAAGGKQELKDNRIQSRGGKFQVEVYAREPEEVTEEIAGASHTFTINEEGGVEFDVVLERQPSSNVFEFPVEGEGLNFYYQGALDPEHPTWADGDGDGAADLFRPEMVVGSYAVYYAEQEGMLKNEETAEKYKVGKAFHVYRPRVTDNGGSAVWGELDYDAERSVLSVTVPEEWLTSAAYPVRIDPNIGYTTAGNSWWTLNANGIRSTFPVTGAPGTAVSITASLEYGDNLSCNSKGNIFDSGWHPLDTVGTNTMMTPSSHSWVTYNYPNGPALTTDTYYPTIWSEKNVGLYYDDAGTSATFVNGASTYAGTWPSSVSTSTMSRKCSIYVTYVEGKSGGPGVGISGGGLLMF